MKETNISEYPCFLYMFVLPDIFCTNEILSTICTEFLMVVIL